MKNTKNNNYLILIIFVLPFFLSSILVQAKEIPTKAPEYNFLDTTNSLDTTVYEKVKNLNIKMLNTKNKVQIGILMIESLENTTIEELANKTARDWKIGDKNTNFGLLLVIAKNDRKVRIETSDNLSIYITDVETNQYINILKPYFKKNQYSQGVNKLLDQLMKEKLDLLSQNKTDEIKNNELDINFIIIAIILLILLSRIYHNSDNQFFGGSSFRPSSSLEGWNNDSSSSSGGWSSGSGGGFSGGGSSGSW